MFHEKTGYFAYMYCKKCHKKTKHLHWQDEVVRSTGGGWLSTPRTWFGLENGYECVRCHNHFNYDGRVKLWRYKRKKVRKQRIRKKR